MNNIQGILSAVVIGICLAAQGPINSNLAKVVSNKVASFHSILTSVVIMGAVVLFTSGFSSYGSITKVSPLYWTGGVLGVIIVFLTVKTIPMIGTAAFFSITVSLQLIVGALINHFGMFGVQKVPMDFMKMAGIALMLIGVRMVVR